MSHVDTTETITHISLCAGYGGIDLGLARAVPNLRTIAFSEIEAFAVANLVSKMEAGLLDAAPIWTDLKTFPWYEFRGKVDILSGGFPCQPFSCAGKRDGDEDPRHLFPYILDGIGRCRPSIVFLENVEGILSAKLSGDNWRDPAGTPVLLHVFRELERVGYKATAGVFSASECGAPHQRKRVFILAYRSCEGHNWRALQDRICGRGISELPQPYKRGCHKIRSEFKGCGGDDGKELDYRDSNGSPTSIPRQEQGHEWQSRIANDGCGQVWPSRPGQPQYEWEPPRVVGNSKHDGLPSKSFIRSYEEAGNNWRKEESSEAREFEGADRSLNVFGIQGSSSGSESAGMGNAAEQGRQGSRGSDDTGGQLFGSTESDRGGDNGSLESEQWQTEPSVGGNLNGSTDWVGHAELYVTCDNRTDELRLLGNGVVPATAELAWITLLNELTNN